MRVNFLFILVLLIMLSSCSKYQYITFDSNLQKNDKGEIAFENDSIIIRYSFEGVDLPLSLRIFNKLKTPLYVNWERSALIMNDKAISNFSDKSSIDAVSQGGEIQWSNSVSSTTQEISGTITNPKQISFIPPNAYIESKQMLIRTSFIKLTDYQKEYVTTSINRYPVKTKSYDKQTAPLKFRSYLTVSTQSNFNDAVTFDNTFWVSNVTETMYKLYDSPEHNKKDKAIITEATDAAIAVVFLGLLAVTGIYLASGVN